MCKYFEKPYRLRQILYLRQLKRICNNDANMETILKITETFWNKRPCCVDYRTGCNYDPPPPGVYYIYNISLIKGEFPRILKESIIKPILKKVISYRQ